MEFQQALCVVGCAAMPDFTFRVKKAIWDQLLAIKAEIIQSKVYFHFACEMP